VLARWYLIESGASCNVGSVHMMLCCCLPRDKARLLDGEQRILHTEYLSLQTLLLISHGIGRNLMEWSCFARSRLCRELHTAMLTPDPRLACKIHGSLVRLNPWYRLGLRTIFCGKATICTRVSASCLSLIATYIGKGGMPPSIFVFRLIRMFRESAQTSKSSRRKGGVQTFSPLPFVACLAFRPFLLACSIPNKEFIKSMLVVIFGVPFPFDAVGVSSRSTSPCSSTCA